MKITQREDIPEKKLPHHYCEQKRIFLPLPEKKATTTCFRMILAENVLIKKIKTNKSTSFLNLQFADLQKLSGNKTHRPFEMSAIPFHGERIFLTHFLFSVISSAPH